ncbi:MAG: hypothetical protein ABIR33_07980 [Pyrinomonadaceae bacterium]
MSAAPLLELLLEFVLVLVSEAALEESLREPDAVFAPPAFADPLAYVGAVLPFDPLFERGPALGPAERTFELAVLLAAGFVLVVDRLFSFVVGMLSPFPGLIGS